MSTLIPELETLVGYSELEAVYGWKRRTLQNWVKAGKLRRGATQPGGEVAWRVRDIQEFQARLFGDLKARAVSDPLKLKAAEVEEAITALGAIHIKNVLGADVLPQDVRIGHVRPATDAEQEAEFHRRLDTWEVAFKHLDWQRQLLVAGWMFPELRQGFRVALEKRGVVVGADDASWRNAAVRAILEPENG